jgi:hypothetical protein
MANIGIQPHVVEEVLNHKKRGVAAIYNRSAYEREVRDAMLRWSEHIHTLIEGREQRKVIPMRPAGGE